MGYENYCKLSIFLAVSSCKLAFIQSVKPQKG